MPAARQTPRAFTLVEILVVLGVIAVLVGLLIPMVNRARRGAERSRIQSDLNAITIALDQYKIDFGDVPRPAEAEFNTGAAVLGKALIGPYGDGIDSTGNVVDDDPPTYGALAAAVTRIEPGLCVRAAASAGSRMYVALVDDPGPTLTDDAKWAEFDPTDGADGPGFRAAPPRIVAGARIPQGKVSGPYLQPEKFRVRGAYLLDIHDSPIQYLPADRGRPNVNRAFGYVALRDFSTNPPRQPLYDVAPALIFFRRPGESDDGNALVRMQSLLRAGTSGADEGAVRAGESPAYTGPFLLWSGGRDRQFGPAMTGGSPPTAAQVAACDDVANFIQR